MNRGAWTGQSSALTIENVNPDAVRPGQRGLIDRDGLQVLIDVRRGEGYRSGYPRFDMERDELTSVLASGPTSLVVAASNGQGG